MNDIKDGAQGGAAEAEAVTVKALQLVARQMQDIIAGCEEHLRVHPDVPKKNTEFTRARAVELWLLMARIQPEANLEADRLNLYDLFFVTLCYLRAQEDPKRLKALRPVEQNLQQLLSSVQQMAIDIQCDKLDLKQQLGPEAMFDLCASVVVYAYSQGTDALLEEVYTYVKTEADIENEEKKAEFDLMLESLRQSGSSSSSAMDTKADKSVLNGLREAKADGQAAMTQDELMVSEMRKAEEAEINSTQASMTAARIISDFIPMCQLVFMNIWLQQLVLDKFRQVDDIKLMPYAKPEAMRATTEDLKRYEDWWKMLLVDPTGAFSQSWQNLAFRSWTVPGMAMFSRRSVLASEEVVTSMTLMRMQYQNDRKKYDLLMKVALVRPQDVLKQLQQNNQQHPMLLYLRLNTFVYQFQQRVDREKPFVDRYLILSDKLAETYRTLASVTNEHGRLQLPRVMLLLGKWYIFDHGRLLSCPDVISACLTWTRIVMLDKRFAGTTEDGASIYKWFRELCLPDDDNKV